MTPPERDSLPTLRRLTARYGSDDYKLETAARGPVHEVLSGRYYAVVREGVPMIERADTCGAVLHIEEDV